LGLPVGESMEEETLSFPQEPAGGYLTLTVDLYVDLGAIPNNQYTAGAAVEKALDVIRNDRSNSDLVVRGKVIGSNYVAYVDRWDKMTVHIRITAVSGSNGICLDCIARKILKAIAKAINAKPEDVIAATY